MKLVYKIFLIVLDSSVVSQLLTECTLHIIPVLKTWQWLLSWPGENTQICWHLCLEVPFMPGSVCVGSAAGVVDHWVGIGGWVKWLWPSHFGWSHPTADQCGQNPGVLTDGLHAYVWGLFQRYHKQAFWPKFIQVNLITCLPQSYR